MYERTYHKQVLKQDAAPAPKKRTPWRKVLFIGTLCLLVSGFVYAAREPRLQIQTVDVTGTEVVDPEDIKQFVTGALDGNLLWVLPRTSTLLIQTETLERAIAGAFPRVERVQVVRQGLTGLSVKLSEYKGVYLWCTKDDSCYFMDSTGMVYSHAPVFSGTAYPKLYTSRPVDELPFMGVTESERRLVAALVSGLNDIHITPSTIRFVGTHELRVDFLHNKDLATFVLDPSVDVQTSLEYLFSGIRTAPLSDLFHNEQKKLLYIDVRYPNNIVYRFAE